MDIRPGLRAEKTVLVEERHTAAHLGSGGVPVYATPSMALHMEETARAAVESFLGPKQATVGSSLDIRHLAPTPQGMEVRIDAELLRVEGRSLHFKVKVRDAVELVGEADHVRFIVDLDRFAARLARKIQAAKEAQP